MSLMTATRMTMAVQNCYGTMKKISTKMGNPSEFMVAVDKYDSDKVNDMMEDKIRELLGDESIPRGLEKYCKKFGINEDLSEVDNISRILLIVDHKDEIKRQLS